MKIKVGKNDYGIHEIFSVIVKLRPCSADWLTDGSNISGEYSELRSWIRAIESDGFKTAQYYKVSLKDTHAKPRSRSHGQTELSLSHNVQTRPLRKLASYLESKPKTAWVVVDNFSTPMS